jgi:hypothetical protein
MKIDAIDNDFSLPMTNEIVTGDSNAGFEGIQKRPRGK